MTFSIKIQEVCPDAIKILIVQTRIGHGLVVKAIIDAAERENADLVAMASHGRTGLSRTCYGTIQMAAFDMLFNT